MFASLTNKGLVTAKGCPLKQFYSVMPSAFVPVHHSCGASQHASNNGSGSNTSVFSHNICVNVLSARTFSLSSCVFKKPGPPSGINKSKAKFRYTQKFLDGGMEEPKLVYNTVTGRSDVTFKKVFIGSGSSPRRLQVLNKLYFDSIREIMTSGMFEDHLIGCNFHVSKVRVLGDLMGVHVFYLQTGSGPELTKEMLKNIGIVVRKELHSHAITPNIPPITFKKDESFDNVIEVERRLAIIAQADQQQQESGQLEPMNQLRLASPAVPDEIFEDDFQYDPSSPLNFAAATAQRSNPKNKPRSSFTPFAPRFSYKREQSPPNATWNRPVRVEWARATPHRSTPRQVPLLTNTFNLNRAAVMSRVEQGLSRVRAFKQDGIDINVYEANMVDFSLERKLLEGDDLEQQQRWEPVLDVMPRPSLQRWAVDYSKKHAKGEFRRRHRKEDLTAGVPKLKKPMDTDFEDVKYFDIEDKLLAHTEAPDYFENES